MGGGRAGARVGGGGSGGGVSYRHAALGQLHARALCSWVACRGTTLCLPVLVEFRAPGRHDAVTRRRVIENRMVQGFAAGTHLGLPRPVRVGVEDLFQAAGHG